MSLTDERITDALDAQLDRIEATLTAVGSEFPFVADPTTGVWETTDDGDWCAGHWIGLLWIASKVTDSAVKRERFEDAAREYTRQHREKGDLEWMFAGMNLFHAGFDAYDITGDRVAYGIGFEGADAMLKLFDERARQVPVGDIQIEGPDDEFNFSEDGGVPGTEVAAVDNIYACLPVLWRAYRETGNPRFRDAAVSHADRHLDWFLREDGSTWNLVQFGPQTGSKQRPFNALAHSAETCWSRGHAWNLAGLAYAYAETGADRYREALDQCLNYYREQTPDDLVPYWDFEVPSIPDTVRDTSAAAITVSGLLSLPDDGDTAEFRAFGERILDTLVSDYLVTDESDDRYGMILHGCYDFPSDYATDHELVWTDYYVAHSLYRLGTSRDLFERP